MDIGFETIGNATVIAHDAGPVLATDPWFEGDAYFGSWTLSHEVPPAQREALLACRYVWVSHGHPDHLSADSLALLKDKVVLVPDHQGHRIHDDLVAQGYKVQTLADRQWLQLSPRVRVMCIPDVNQDAVLLIDVGGVLVVNLNDASDRGWGRFVRRIIRGYPRSFLLALSGYGDADMINYFTEDGRPIPPPAAQRTPVGQTIARQAELYGVRWFVPFSSMHKYQRADSAWAGQYTTTLQDYPRGFASRSCELLPAFIRYDCARDAVEELRPAERHIVPRPPQDFGDDWSERLEPGEPEALERYFKQVRHLEKSLDYLRFKVGGQEHVVTFHARRFHKGITFEVPRHSLMTAVRYEIFDDLLIGNFMKTTLHGPFGERGLYPDFTPYVAKYSDNGRARTPQEVDAYFDVYRARDPLGFLRHQLEANYLLPLQQKSANTLRSVLRPDSSAYRRAKDLYWGVRRTLL